MNSSSGVPRRPASDIALAVLAAIIVISVSQAARHYLPAPQGKLWIWLPTVVGLVVAYGFSRDRTAPAYRWVLLYAAGGLPVQAALQAIVALDVARL